MSTKFTIFLVFSLSRWTYNEDKLKIKFPSTSDSFMMMPRALENKDTHVALLSPPCLGQSSSSVASTYRSQPLEELNLTNPSTIQALLIAQCLKQLQLEKTQQRTQCMYPRGPQHGIEWMQQVFAGAWTWIVSETPKKSFLKCDPWSRLARWKTTEHGQLQKQGRENHVRGITTHLLLPVLLCPLSCSHLLPGQFPTWKCDSQVNSPALSQSY